MPNDEVKFSLRRRRPRGCTDGPAARGGFAVGSL